MNNLPHILVVLGPTASGKSDYAIELALIHNGEIISADSRQVYKDLDIGTGKVTKKEMKGVTHHMLSVYEIDEEISVARFARDTLPIIHDILSRNKTPIICGGTGQYIDALIFDTEIPKVPPNKNLRTELEKLSSEELLSAIKNKDKVRATTIDPHNRVRMIRALEIIEALGTVPALSTPSLRFDTTIYIMNPTRELLRKRITARLHKRLAVGMIHEVQVIMNKGYTSESMKQFGLEYVSIGKFLEGTLSEEAMHQDIITKSMQYVKRQETWNKKYFPLATLVPVIDSTV